MKSIYQKLFAFVLLIVTLFSLLVPIAVSAVDVTDASEWVTNLETSSVDEDLSLMKMADSKGELTKRFNINDYPLNTKDDRIELITLYEYGYTKESGISDTYGLYLYFYNPSGKTVVNADNAVNMSQAVDANGNGTSYERVGMTLLSTTADNRFLKFKLNPKENQEPFQTVTQDGIKYRIYDIAVVYLNHGKGEPNKAYSNAIAYKYSGYAEDDTLKVSGKETVVLELDLKQTWYRLNSSPLGKYHYSTLNSVYFSVPETVFDRYTTVTGAEMDWYEYRTKPVLYFTDEATAQTFDALLGGCGDKDFFGGRGPMGDQVTDMNIEEYEIFLGTEVNKIHSYWLFDRVYHNHAGAFYAPNAASKSMDLLIDGKGKNITGERILEKIKSYSSDTFEQLGSDITSIQGAPYRPLDGASSYSKYYFSDDVDKGRTRGYNHVYLTDDSFQIVEAFKGGFFAKFFEYGWNFPDFEPSAKYPVIDELTDVSSKVSAEDIGINEYDLNGILKDVAYAKTRDERTFLLRFATTDYFYAKCDESVPGSVYMSQQTAFLNLNVLSLTVEKDGVKTVIPVSADSIDVMGDPTTSEKENMFLGFLNLDSVFSVFDLIGDFFNTFRVIILFLIIVLIAYFVFKFIRWVGSTFISAKKENMKIVITDKVMRKHRQRKEKEEMSKKDIEEEKKLQRRDDEDERRQARRAWYQEEAEDRRERRLARKREADKMSRIDEYEIKKIIDKGYVGDRLDEYEEKKKIDQKYRGNGKKKG